MADLGFHIEVRGGVQVLVWADGSCRPASTSEIAMWARIAWQQEKLEAYDQNYTVAFSQNEQMRGRIAELQGENFKLAAGQCLHTIHGDERGNSYCPRIRELEAQLSAAREALPHVLTGLDEHWVTYPENAAAVDQLRALLADSGEGRG